MDSAGSSVVVHRHGIVGKKTNDLALASVHDFGVIWVIHEVHHEHSNLDLELVVETMIIKSGDGTGRESCINGQMTEVWVVVFVEFAVVKAMEYSSGKWDLRQLAGIQTSCLLVL